MDTEGLNRLVAELRSVRADTHSVEVKSAVRKLPKSLAETLSAFSNSAGGTVILGLDEGMGFRPDPGFDALRTREALARACADDIHPQVRSVIEILPFEGAQVVVTEVPEISPLSKPAYVRGRGEYQGSFIRGGDGDRKLSDYEVALLHANRGQPRDDREPVTGASIGDLDDDAVSALLQRMRRRQPRAFRPVSDQVALRRLGVLVPNEPESEKLVPSGTKRISPSAPALKWSCARTTSHMASTNKQKAPATIMATRFFIPGRPLALRSAPILCRRL